MGCEPHLEQQMVREIYEGMLTDADRASGLTWEQVRHEDEVESMLEREYEEGYEDGGESEEVIPTYFDVVEQAQECDTFGLDIIMVAEAESGYRALVQDEDGWYFTTPIYFEYGLSGSYWEPSEPSGWRLSDYE